VKNELCGGHSNCYWVEVIKIAEEMERSKEKQAVGRERARMTYQQEIWIEDSSTSRKSHRWIVSTAQEEMKDRPVKP
jgi:hypothetical protein